MDVRCFVSQDVHDQHLVTATLVQDAMVTTLITAHVINYWHSVVRHLNVSSLIKKSVMYVDNHRMSYVVMLTNCKSTAPYYDMLIKWKT